MSGISFEPSDTLVSLALQMASSMIISALAILVFCIRLQVQGQG